MDCNATTVSRDATNYAEIESIPTKDYHTFKFGPSSKKTRICDCIPENYTPIEKPEARDAYNIVVHFDRRNKPLHKET